MLEGIWLRTGRELYHLLARFWTKIFAVSFGMGVVSGMVMSYQFGTNWSRFSAIAGKCIGPLLGYEVLTAFFLEASFLGVMLFGWKRVPPWLHFFAAVMVASARCSRRSGSSPPTAGCRRRPATRSTMAASFPVDWLAIIFNPRFPYRLAHMVTAAYLTTSFVVAGVGARYLLRGRLRRGEPASCCGWRSA